ncbi:MAG: AsnC family transcriptional regulator [Alphaproteobacteria bacterium]|jgi:DNA-binding Lrp family transcriptional regulator|nr:AsnC family transcriptional regulator [Alphaproteobacteria bacterium]MDP6831395.1 AsnC family transcriptional regulator [Alphaproteobacteria bacterium]
MNAADNLLDETDRRIIVATQGGLPLVAEPYREVADELELDADDVMARMQRMLDGGLIRRIGAVPNHYALGYRANGMSVWDVPDEDISDIGKMVGDLDFVSHCYHRPRHLPYWSYNLFAMVHGRDRDEVSDKVERIAKLMGIKDRGHQILYSSRILKKTGLRFAG